MSSALDLYTAHFNLGERPFSLVPDPGYMYWSPAHRRALAILDYGIVTCAPITLITGEVGTGKTTLLQHMLQELGEDVRVALVSGTTGARGDLLAWVLQALGEPLVPGEGEVALFARLEALLLAEYAAGRRVLLIFDEAQTLGRDGLEALRLLTNINSHKDELLQLVLVGQPELRDMVRAPDMTQFAQRIAAAFHLQAMDPATVAAYVAHRLEVAGGAPGIFTPEALALIALRSRGVPRLVNQLCDLALVYAAAAGAAGVDADLVRQVLDDGVFFADQGPLPAAACATE